MTITQSGVPFVLNEDDAMKAAEHRPTLVTLESAEAFRDAGIRYAQMRTGLWLGGAAACALGAYAAANLEADWSLWTWLALLSAWAAALAVGFYCGNRSEFPHTPRVSLDDLQTMRDDMGLPAAVFAQTHDAVIHGTVDDWRAMRGAKALIERSKIGADRADPA